MSKKRFVTIVSPEHYFYLHKDGVLKDLAELVLALRTMPDEVFNFHVTKEKNDFASWVEGIFKEPGLAKRLRAAASSQEMVGLLTNYLHRGKTVFETIIIGAGIAGIAAAVYASRKRMYYKIFSEDFGGQVNVAGEIENYPGIARTDWMAFRKALEEQVKYNNIEITYERVEKVERSGCHFLVRTNNGVYEAETVLVCSGARARKLGVPGEAEFAGKGLSYCAVCDGPLFADKTVAVVGGGDAALEAADFLLRIAKKIYLVTINPKMMGHEYLLERVVGHPKVTVIAGAKTKSVFGEKFVKGLAYEKDGKTHELAVDGIFVEVGRVPNIECVKDLVRLDDHAHIVVDQFGESSVKGLYAAGDCTNVHEYQFAIAGGQAVLALLKISRYLMRA